jgi:hypothetical protein
MSLPALRSEEQKRLLLAIETGVIAIATFATKSVLLG